MGVGVRPDQMAGTAQRPDVGRFEKSPLANAAGDDEEMCFPVAFRELLGDVQRARAAVVEGEEQVAVLPLPLAVRLSWVTSSGVSAPAAMAFR